MKVKKILGLGILLLSFFGINFGYGGRIFHDVNDEFTITNATVFTQKVLSSSAGVVYGGGMGGKAIILLQENGRRNSITNYERRYIYFRGTDNKLYAYGNKDGTMSEPSNFEYLRFDSFVRYAGTGFVSKDYGGLNDSPGEIVSAESFYNNTQLKSAMTRYAYLYTNTSNTSNSFTAFCWIYDNLGFSICVKPASAMTTELTPVSGLSIDPVEFNTSLLGTSPWTSDINGGGNTETGNDNIETITGGQQICPLLKFEIDLYGRKYNESLCYSDGTTNSGGEIINTGKIDIFTAYPTYQDYLDGYQIYVNYCNQESPRYSIENCRQYLQTLPYGKAGATIIYNAIQNNLPLEKVYQYCHLQLNFTEEQKRGSGKCEFTDDERYAPGITGELKQEAGANTVQGLADKIKYSDAEFISPEDGYIFDDILPDGIISRKNIIFNLDFFGNITKLIAKILILFKTRPIVNGILPPAILSLLLLIILFKIYKK